MDETGRHEADELTLEPVTVVRSRRPRALWGVLAAVAVATGALVVTSAGDDGSPRPGLPVAFGSAAGGRDEGAASADAMRAWITYVAGDDLPALGDDAPAYRLVGQVDEAQVQALADALGVDGAIVHDGPTWKVGDDEGSLEVYEGGGAQWWYSLGGGDIAVSGAGSSTGSAGCSGNTDDVVVDCDAAPPVTTIPPCDASDPSDCGATECPPNARCDFECPDHPTTAASARCVGPVPPDDVECTEKDGCVEPVPLPVDPAPPADLPSDDDARATPSSPSADRSTPGTSRSSPASAALPPGCSPTSRSARRAPSPAPAATSAAPSASATTRCSTPAPPSPAPTPSWWTAPATAGTSAWPPPRTPAAPQAGTRT
jgi:hypothetical protein